uniref:Uncharacterized protein n=1 Tax=Acrobeloides nanus TaxID=290746 RepID=A0A914CBV7_9BILA
MTVKVDNSEFSCLKKLPKAHERGIIGVEVFREVGTNDLIMATFAHDSLKFWAISAFDDEVLLDQRQEIKRWLCGMQSYDIAQRGKVIGIVGAESTLHQLLLDGEQNYVLTDLNLGYMQIWFVRIAPDKSSFLTVNFSSSLRLIDLNGEVITSVPFDNAKQISSIVYSNTGKYIAFGTTLGWISVLDSSTLASSYAFEGHAMKIRALTFTMDDKYVLSGSDDKTIKLLDFTLPPGSKEVCIRMFCGHRGAILHIRLDPASKGQRFASSATDMRVILWDLDSGNQLHVFSNCFEDVVTSLTFASGRFLISATDAGTVFVNRVPLPENYEELVEEEITAKTPEEEFVEEEITAKTPEEELVEENGNLNSPEEEPMVTEEIEQTINGHDDYEPVETETLEQPEQQHTELEPSEMNKEEAVTQESPKENDEDFERQEIEMQLGID